MIHQAGALSELKITAVCHSRAGGNPVPQSLDPGRRGDDKAENQILLQPTASVLFPVEAVLF